MGFFNNLKETVTDAGQTVANKSREISGNAKLNNKIRENNKSIESLKIQVADTFLASCGDEPGAEYAEFIAQIKTLQAENEELQKEINANKGIEEGCKCPKCGQENVAGAKFCVGCGAQLQEAPKEKFCPECGTSNAADAAFCSGCGKAL